MDWIQTVALNVARHLRACVIVIATTQMLMLFTPLSLAHTTAHRVRHILPAKIDHISISGNVAIDITSGQPNQICIETTSPPVKSPLHRPDLIQHQQGRQLQLIVANTRRIHHISIQLCQLQQLILHGKSHVVAKHLRTPRLSIIATGAGKIRLSGHTGILHIRAGGRSVLDLRGLQAERTYVKTFAHAHVAITPEDILYAEASDTSDIYYQGMPKFRAIFLNGRGSVLPLSAKVPPIPVAWQHLKSFIPPQGHPPLSIVAGLGNNLPWY